jgi:uncharacterized protein
MNIEKRTFPFTLEIRADGEKRQMVGHAAVFNDPIDLGYGIRERVAAGAFADSIKRDDVRALFNHDPNFVLGRNRAGTLTLKEDEQGLAVIIDPPDTQFARDLAISMERGDISQMSFAFVTEKESWERGEDGADDIRTLEKVQLYDVSPVTYPAYANTDIAVKSRSAWQLENVIPAWNSINIKRKRYELKTKEATL